MTLIKRTLPDMFRSLAHIYGPHTMLAQGQIRRSYQEAYTCVIGLAAAWAEKGIGVGCHVALFGMNSPNWLMAFLALEQLGAIPVLMNYNVCGIELGHMLVTSDAEILLVGDLPDTASPNLVAEALALPGIAVREVIDISGCQLLADPSVPASAHDLPHPPGDCHATCAMLFTTGTTAFPKAVMLSHYGIINDALSGVQDIGVTCDDRICLASPLFHCLGLITSALFGIFHGAGLYMPLTPKPRDVLATMVDDRCTIILCVPMLMLSVARHRFDRAETVDLSALRLCFMGGSPCTDAQLNALFEAFPHTHFSVGYGLTEASPCVSRTPYIDSEAHIKHTVGLPIPGTEVMIQHPETGRLSQSLTPGEVLVRGYHVMQGYYRDTESLIDADGWLHTQDIGCFTEDGYLVITGRIKEIIIRGGENISPHEIEAAIAEYPPVWDVKVFGVPHDVLGEEVEACVIMKKGFVYEEAKLRAFLQTRLAAYKIPVHIFPMDAFPTAGNGKLDVQRLVQDVTEIVRPLQIQETLARRARTQGRR